MEPFLESRKRKAIQRTKVYFFDCGVMHTLSGTEHVDRNSNLYGSCFEHFIINEVKAYNSYREKHKKLCYWREKNGKEVDLLIGGKVAVEIKSTGSLSKKDFKGLRALQEEQLNFEQYILVSQDTVERSDNGVLCLPYAVFLKRLWAGEIF